MKKFKINYVNCYCLLITIAFVIISQALITISTNLSNRIDILENQIQKNEAVINDANHLIQLHY
jgi:archaellum component FlaG (FlaF/FlaG flagellin family)